MASTSANKVYSGPLMPAIHAAIPEVVAIDRCNMSMWGTTLRAAGYEIKPA